MDVGKASESPSRVQRWLVRAPILINCLVFSLAMNLAFAFLAIIGGVPVQVIVLVALFGIPATAAAAFVVTPYRRLTKEERLEAIVVYPGSILNGLSRLGTRALVWLRVAALLATGLAVIYVPDRPLFAGTLCVVQLITAMLCGRELRRRRRGATDER